MYPKACSRIQQKHKIGPKAIPSPKKQAKISQERTIASQNHQSAAGKQHNQHTDEISRMYNELGKVIIDSMVATLKSGSRLHQSTIAVRVTCEKWWVERVL